MRRAQETLQGNAETGDTGTERKDGRSMAMIKAVLGVWAVINLFVFGLYGDDKRRAKSGQWRIPERVLLFAALFGAPGALLGMLFFHHKTRKPKFAVGVPAILIAEAALVFWWLFETGGLF